MRREINNQLHTQITHKHTHTRPTMLVSFLESKSTQQMSIPNIFRRSNLIHNFIWNFFECIRFQACMFWHDGFRFTWNVFGLVEFPLINRILKFSKIILRIYEANAKNVCTLHTAKCTSSRQVIVRSAISYAVHLLSNKLLYFLLLFHLLLILLLLPSMIVRFLRLYFFGQLTASFFFVDLVFVCCMACTLFCVARAFANTFKFYTEKVFQA